MYQAFDNKHRTLSIAQGAPALSEGVSPAIQGKSLIMVVKHDPNRGLCYRTIFLSKLEYALKGTVTRKSMWALNVHFSREDNNATIYLGVKHTLTELLQPKVGTIRCIYAIWLCTRTAYLKKGNVTISFRMMTSSANCLTSKMFT